MKKIANPKEDNSELLQAEARERVRKLQLESRILENQGTARAIRLEAFKAYAGIAGLITAGVAALAFLASLFQISENFRRSDASFEAERFGKALTLLSEARAAQRLTGLTYLASLMSGHGQYRTQAAETLANMLGLEDDAIVRRSIRDALVDYVNFSNTTRENRARLQRVLTQLSRAMIERHSDLMNMSADICADIEISKQADACETKKRLGSVSSVLVSLVQKDATSKDLAGIYCADCVFKNLKLDGYDFAGAILVGADFSGASLNAATFVNANLIKADFQNAVLQRADFSVDRENYVHRNFRTRPGRDDNGARNFVRGASFRCADLAGAKFAGHPVFRILSDRQRNITASGEPLFWWANLNEADFSTSHAFGVTNEREGPFKVHMFSGGIPATEGFFYMEWHLWPESHLQINESSHYWRSLEQGVSFGIVNANWKGAKWPEGIRSLLEQAEKRLNSRAPKGPDDKWLGSTDAPDKLEAPAHCIGLRSLPGGTRR